MIKNNGNHMAGGKVSGAHTTVIDAAKKVVKQVDRMPEVSKVVLGVITPRLPVGRHLVKFLPINGGIKVVVRGTNSKQELFVYTSEPQATEMSVKELFE